VVAFDTNMDTAYCVADCSAYVDAGPKWVLGFACLEVLITKEWVSGIMALARLCSTSELEAWYECRIIGANLDELRNTGWTEDEETPVSVGWSPACVASPRRGYRRVWVVPGGETRGVCGFQPPRL
jgi:hypothetical protein